MESTIDEKQARIWVKCKFPPRIRAETNKANQSTWTDWEFFSTSSGTVQNQHLKLKWHPGSTRWYNFRTEFDREWTWQHSSSLCGILARVNN